MSMLADELQEKLRTVQDNLNSPGTLTLRGDSVALGVSHLVLSGSNFSNTAIAIAGTVTVNNASGLNGGTLIINEEANMRLGANLQLNNSLRGGGAVELNGHALNLTTTKALR